MDLAVYNRAPFRWPRKEDRRCLPEAKKKANRKQSLQKGIGLVRRIEPFEIDLLSGSLLRNNEITTPGMRETYLPGV